MGQSDQIGIRFMAISADEKVFFEQLGGRIAERRKTLNITQVQMAEILRVSQQTVNSYEVGRRRVPASALPILAKTLMMSLEELVGESPQTIKNKRGPTPKLQQQMELLSQLPKAKQKFVIEMLDAVIQQQAG